MIQAKRPNPEPDNPEPSIFALEDPEESSLSNSSVTIAATDEYLKRQKELQAQMQNFLKEVKEKKDEEGKSLVEFPEDFDDQVEQVAADNKGQAFDSVVDALSAKFLQDENSNEKEAGLAIDVVEMDPAKKIQLEKLKEEQEKYEKMTKKMQELDKKLMAKEREARELAKSRMERRIIEIDSQISKGKAQGSKEEEALSELSNSSNFFLTKPKRESKSGGDHKSTMESQEEAQKQKEKNRKEKMIYEQEHKRFLLEMNLEQHSRYDELMSEIMGMVEGQKDEEEDEEKTESTETAETAQKNQESQKKFIKVDDEDDSKEEMTKPPENEQKTKEKSISHDNQVGSLEVYTKREEEIDELLKQFSTDHSAFELNTEPAINTDKLPKDQYLREQAEQRRIVKKMDEIHMALFDVHTKLANNDKADPERIATMVKLAFLAEKKQVEAGVDLSRPNIHSISEMEFEELAEMNKKSLEICENIEKSLEQAGNFEKIKGNFSEFEAKVKETVRKVAEEVKGGETREEEIEKRKALEQLLGYLNQENSKVEGMIKETVNNQQKLERDIEQKMNELRRYLAFEESGNDAQMPPESFNPLKSDEAAQNEKEEPIGNKKEGVDDLPVVTVKTVEEYDEEIVNKLRNMEEYKHLFEEENDDDEANGESTKTDYYEEMIQKINEANLESEN